MNRTPKRISRISAIHFGKLVFRSLLLIAAVVFYILIKKDLYPKLNSRPGLLIVLWIIFFVEMVFRFFPSKWESMGCQKQFARNYRPIKDGIRPEKQSDKSTVIVAIVWIALNAVIGLLYFTDVIDKGILVLISLFYSVCDMICILFFCPFQTWIMKNRCCTTCRIYNWDYAMMFTPLIFLVNPFSISIIICSVALLIRWEIAYHRHPERFSEKTNRCLSCAECQEKLCSHKKQLYVFWVHQMDYIRSRNHDKNQHI